MPKVAPVNVIMFRRSDWDNLVTNQQLYGIEKAIEGISKKDIKKDEYYVVLPGSTAPAVGLLKEFENIYYKIHEAPLDIQPQNIFKHEGNSEIQDNLQRVDNNSPEGEE